MNIPIRDPLARVIAGAITAAATLAVAYVATQARTQQEPHDAFLERGTELEFVTAVGGATFLGATPGFLSGPTILNALTKLASETYNYFRPTAPGTAPNVELAGAYDALDTNGTTESQKIDDAVTLNVKEPEVAAAAQANNNSPIPTTTGASSITHSPVVPSPVVPAVPSSDKKPTTKKKTGPNSKKKSAEPSALQELQEPLMSGVPAPSAPTTPFGHSVIGTGHVAHGTISVAVPGTPAPGTPGQ